MAKKQWGWGGGVGERELSACLSSLFFLLSGKNNTGTSFHITQVSLRSLGGFWHTVLENFSPNGGYAILAWSHSIIKLHCSQTSQARPTLRSIACTKRRLTFIPVFVYDNIIWRGYHFIAMYTCWVYMSMYCSNAAAGTMVSTHVVEDNFSKGSRFTWPWWPHFVVAISWSPLL